MAFDDLLIDTITVYTVSAGTTDRYGNPTDDLSSGVEYAARVEPFKVEELEGGRRDTRIALFRVFTDADAIITGTSLVDYQGTRYEVFGDVKMYEDGVGPHHLEFELRGITG